MPQAFTPTGQPVYADWTQPAIDALFAQFKMIDPAKTGLDRSKLRLFYPYMGWNDIQKGLDALIAAGRLEHSMTYVDGRALETFLWKGQ